MTEKLLGVSPTSTEPSQQPSAEELETARGLVRQARSRGVDLTGPQGLLKALTKTDIETALDEEMSEHLGYDKHETVGRNLGNSRNGKRSKTLLTSSSGDVQIDMPRDRDGTFEPVIVRKRQRRLTDVDEVVLSLYAKGLTTGEISAHFEQIYGAAVSKDTVSRITDKIIEEMQAWSNRPLERIYAAVFIDAIMVKVRDGQVGNRPVYAHDGIVRILDDGATTSLASTSTHWCPRSFGRSSTGTGPTATSWLGAFAEGGLLDDIKLGRDRLFVNREFLQLLVRAEPSINGLRTDGREGRQLQASIPAM